MSPAFYHTYSIVVIVTLCRYSCRHAAVFAYDVFHVIVLCVFPCGMDVLLGLWTCLFQTPILYCYLCKHCGRPVGLGKHPGQTGACVGCGVLEPVYGVGWCRWSLCMVWGAVTRACVWCGVLEPVYCVGFWSLCMVWGAVAGGCVWCGVLEPVYGVGCCHCCCCTIHRRESHTPSPSYSLPVSSSLSCLGEKVRKTPKDSR